MKKIFLSFLIVFCFSFSFCQVSVNGNVSHTYTTLKNAFDAINNGTITGNIIVTLNGSTTETSTATLNSSGTGSANYNSITISSSSSVIINGNVPGSLITFNGANKVSIDGKKQLTISNTNTSGNTISFLNDASNNKIINTIIKGAGNNINNGVVFFGTGNLTGNDNNTLDNCDIDGSFSGMYAVHSLGSISSVAIENSSDTISNCNIFNYRQSSGNTAGIFLNYGSTNWSVNNNNFYQTTAISTSVKGIYYGIIALPQFATDTHQINDNYIGGNAPKATGTLSISGTSSATIGFVGMDIETGGPNNLVKNNTIKGITISYSNTAESFQNAGVFCYLSAFNGSSTISNNTVSDFNFTNTSGLLAIQGITCTVQASDFDASKDTFNILNNSILNVTGNSGGTGDVQLYGIRLNNNSAPNLSTFPTIQPVYNVTGNTISNFNAPFSGSNTYIRGISNLNSTEIFSNVTIVPTYNIIGNSIHGFSTNSVLGSYTSGVIEGIKLTGGQGSFNTPPKHFISKNIIYDLNANQGGNSSTSVIGIYTSNGSYIIEKNKLYGFVNKAIATTVSPYIIGIHIRSSQGATNVQNNFISLGNQITNDMNIFGILNSYSTDSIKIYFNSVVIAGSGATGNKLITAALGRSSGTGDEVHTITDIKNNIFINYRSTGPGNYALYSNSATGWNSNNNDLYSASTSSLSYFNNVTQDFSGYKSLSKQDANSVNTQVTFLDYISGDLHLNNPPSSLKSGTSINGIKTDIDEKTRDANTPFLGADEYGGSVTNTNSSDFINVFPNPASNILNIHINGNAPGNAIISISNSIAQKVVYNAVTVGAAGVTTSINISAWSRGVYFVRVELNGNRITKKIIKI